MITPTPSAAQPGHRVAEQPLDTEKVPEEQRHVTFLRPRDELVANVRNARSLELALQFIMEAEPLDATIDCPKRRRIANRAPEQFGIPRSDPENLPSSMSPAAEARKSITQQIRDAQTEELALELLMDASCAENAADCAGKFATTLRCTRAPAKKPPRLVDKFLGAPPPLRLVHC